MKIVIIALVAALPALAQSPANYRANAEVIPTGPDALMLLELPFEAYRDARRDLGDIRIFNTAGDSVPYAWAPDPGRLTEPAVPVDLPIFPVRKLPPAGEATTEVTVRAADGTLISIRGKQPQRVPGKANGPKSAAWLLDASHTNEPVQAIAFDWEAGPGTELVNVRVEGSDDLKAWSTLGTAPLVRLGSAGGRTLLQPRVDFTPRKLKYLRVTAEAPAFEPTAVRAEYIPRGKPLPRLSRTLTATPSSEKPEDLVFDLGAPLPVEALRLAIAQDNAVVVASIFVRNDPAEQWKQLTTATFYRLQREGVESTSPLRELGGQRPARYWLVRLNPGSSQGTPPKLEVQWAPARLVFVKQGDAPFHLAFGNQKAPAQALPIESIIPNYKKGAEDLLKQAKLGTVMAGPPPNRWEKLIGEMDARRVTLWMVLIGGVGALGAMAWKLSRPGR